MEEDTVMILKEGDKVRKIENGIVYQVSIIHEKGFVILKSEDGARSTLIDLRELDQYASSDTGCPIEESR
jgi:hypothetical protein